MDHPVYRILIKTLEMSNMYAQWVPCKLLENHRTHRMGSTLDFFTRFEHEGNNLLDQIVLGDES